MKKRFLKNIIPDYRFKKITDIPPDFFTGAQLIVLDLDNTLVFSSTTKTTPEIIDWLSRITTTYRCIIFSNSFNFFKRAPGISQLFDCELFLNRRSLFTLLRARKPFRKLFSQMKNKYQFADNKVFVVGDRLFTDVLFGNTNHATTVLVNPLSRKENIIIKAARMIEGASLFLIEKLK